MSSNEKFQFGATMPGVGWWSNITSTLEIPQNNHHKRKQKEHLLLGH